MLSPQLSTTQRAPPGATAAGAGGAAMWELVCSHYLAAPPAGDHQAEQKPTALLVTAFAITLRVYYTEITWAAGN